MASAESTASTLPAIPVNSHAAQLMDPFAEPVAAYLHVPFCAHRCGYCDFTLVAGRNDLAPRYLVALSQQLQTLEKPRPVQTIFIGGGTPTHLAPGELQQLLALIDRWFPLPPGGEFTVEANPAGLSNEKLLILSAGRVNRISLGVQSFSAPVLAQLERDHSPAEALDTIARCRAMFENVSLDLIFGVPGQSLPCWRETLQTAISTGATHLSTYGLTFEKGTRFWARREHGDLTPVPNELEAEMYEAAREQLTASGFRSYELSNWAQPGWECRHNLVYWAGGAYYGFGPGAVGYQQGTRQSNHRSLFTWLKRIDQRQSPLADKETLSDLDRAKEMLVIGLRRTAGVDRHSFRTQTGYDIHDLCGPALLRLQSQQLIEFDDALLRLTPAGRLMADTVTVDLL